MRPLTANGLLHIRKCHILKTGEVEEGNEHGAPEEGKNEIRKHTFMREEERERETTFI